MSDRYQQALDRLRAAREYALERRAELIATCGGRQPTDDEITAALEQTVSLLRSRGEDDLAARFLQVTRRFWQSRDAHRAGLDACLLALNRGELPNYDELNRLQDRHDEDMEAYERVEADVRASFRRA